MLKDYLGILVEILFFFNGPRYLLGASFIAVSWDVPCNFAAYGLLALRFTAWLIVNSYFFGYMFCFMPTWGYTLGA